jgi:hypothetical protein
VPLDRTSEVEVAGVLRLRLVPFLDDGTLPAERLAGLPNLPGPGELWELAERSRLPALRSLLVQRVNNLADAESYLLVYRWARVGGDQPSEIPLPESCNEPPCLRIVRLGGQFWLESLTGRDCLTVDGIAMRKGQFWPLKPSAALGCARCGFQFAPFAQHGL